MNADKRWSVDIDGDLWWSSGIADPYSWSLDVHDLRRAGFGEKVAPAFVALVDAVRSQERMRAIEAIAAEWDQRGATWCMKRITELLEAAS